MRFYAMRVFILALSLCWLYPALCFSLVTKITPERILIVANEKSPISRRITALYQQVRKIPQENVLFLKLPLREEIDRPIYLRFLEKPVASYIRRHQMQDKILVILLMPDVPHKIRGSIGQNGKASSVDSELTLLYRKMLFGPYRLSGWIKNPYFRSPLDQPFEHDRYDFYLVTRLDGYQEKDIWALITRAQKARKTRPPFTLVLDAKDGPAAPGDNWLHAAYLLLKNFPGLKLEASFDSAFLVSGERVIGYASWGSNDPNYPRDRKLFFKFLPGAIGVTYVSTSARTFVEPPPGWEVGAPWHAKHKLHGGSPQSLIGDLIRLGITGVSGNAYEPYLSACARPNLLFPAYLKGKTLAEAYYRSLAYLSWQTVVIGDPLAHLGNLEVDHSPYENWFAKRKAAFEKAQKSKDYLFLAKIDLHLGFPERALKRLKKLKEKREKLPEGAYQLLFVIAEKKHMMPKVLRFLREDTAEEARIISAFILFREKKYKQAEKILMSGPLNSATGLFLLGKIELARGACGKTIPLIERAIALKPDAWGFYPDLYQALKACGNKDRAQHIRQKILSMPELVELWPRFKN